VIFVRTVIRLLSLHRFWADASLPARRGRKSANPGPSRGSQATCNYTGLGTSCPIKIMRFSMKIAMMTFILTAVMSVSSYAAGSYNAVAAYGACQEDGLKGVHYALEGNCPNWEAWKTNHMRAQAPSQRHVYPTSTRRHRPNQQPNIQTKQPEAAAGTSVQIPRRE
jgi:hypothetical protein